MNGPLGRIRFHGRPEPLEADGGLVEAPPRQDVGQTADLDFRGQPTRVLGEKTERPHSLDLAAGRRQLPAQDSEQARFPRSVTADQTHLVAGADAERGVRQSRAAPDFDAQVGGNKHSSMIAARKGLQADFCPAAAPPVRGA